MIRPVVLRRLTATLTIGAGLALLALVGRSLTAYADGGETEVSGLAAPARADAPRAPEPLAPDARPEVDAWAPASGRDCHVFHRRRMCDGPRRVPLLEGTSRERAEALGLIGPRVAHLATSAAPPSVWVEAAREAGASPSPDLLFPVAEGRIWRGFGMRHGIRVVEGHSRRSRGRHMHEGMDIGAPEGSLIHAVEDGLVVYSDNRMHGYGNAVLVVHPNGDVSLYAHCVETYVVAGQHVHRGEPIAAVGQTGLAHGAHLHFEYRRGGRRIDPRPLFSSIPSLEDVTALREAERADAEDGRAN